MSSSLLAKGNAIHRETATDLSAAIGKLCTYANGVPTVSNSATVPATHIVLDARKRVTAAATYYDNQIGAIGALPGPVRAILSAASAAVKFGDGLIQAADGTLTADTGAGNARVYVGTCDDENGAQPGDEFAVAFVAPQIRA